MEGISNLYKKSFLTLFGLTPPPPPLQGSLDSQGGGVTFSVIYKVKQLDLTYYTF